MDFVTKEASFLSEDVLEEVYQQTYMGEFDPLLKQELFEENANCMGSANFCVNESSSIQNLQFSFLAQMPDSTQNSSNGMVLVPSATGRLPSRDDYLGPCNFSIELTSQSSHTRKWRYSAGLNKIYVTMLSKIPLKFKWNQECGLYVRALPIFLDEDSFEQPVTRCVSHSSPLEESNKDFQYVHHIIRCDHECTVYDFDPESKRLSTLVPLDRPQPGTDCTTVVYTFVCKNSCHVGINRRATAVVFTLERESGEVVGRKMVNVRICSCPKRDMDKEESIEERKNEGEPESSTKEEINIQYVGKRPSTSAKILKRLHSGTVNFSIRLPRKYVKTVARNIKNIVSLDEENRELTYEEKLTVNDCNKYIK